MYRGLQEAKNRLSRIGLEVPDSNSCEYYLLKNIYVITCCIWDMEYLKFNIMTSPPISGGEGQGDGYLYEYIQ